MPEALRKTKHAELCADASLSQENGNEHRIERMWLKQAGGAEVIRWSWWRQGRMMPRAPHLTEAELVNLLDKGIEAGVFTPFFLRQLLLVMERRAEMFVTE